MEKEEDLRYYLEVLKKRWVILIIIPLVATVTSGVISFFFSSKPLFIATTTLVMGKPTESLIKQSDQTNKIDLDTILAAPKLAMIFEPVIKSRNVEQRVIEQLNLPFNEAQLHSKVTVRSVENSDLIEISVTDHNPELAAEIANSLADNFSKVVVDIKKVDTVNILDKAIAPEMPIKVDNMRNIIYTFFISLITASIIAIFSNYLDNTLKNGREIEEILGLPLIGMIPYNSKTLFKKKFSPSEAYRTLRTNIKFNDFYNVKKRILITSTGPGEGKSEVAVNLGNSLVEIGKRVLIIDANLRIPVQHKLFELDNEKGLSNILTRELPILDYIAQTKIQGLEVLTSGPNPSNPAELLASNNMRYILSETKEIYDVVIIDSPPSVALADASIISQVVDGVIFVVGSGEASREHALEAKRQLEKVGAELIGVVLNKVNLKTKEYKYYYDYREKKKRFKRNSVQQPSQQISL